MPNPRPHSGASTRYPIATIAAYGPDSTLATKLVVSVVERPGRDPSVMQTWTTLTADVRHDRRIAAEVLAFLAQHRVTQSLKPDVIIGCPHEEGVDYPMGRTCPQCPFWAGIDRFTHEPLETSEPTMTPAEILTALSSVRSVPPREALQSADAHRPALVGELLRALDAGLADPSGTSEGEATLFSYALYLLARWREVLAYPYVIRWLSLRGEDSFGLAGDVVTQDGPRILAAVCDGNLEPIKALVLDTGANEYCRAVAMSALALLAAWAEVPRERILGDFLWFAHEGLEREPSAVWDSLAANSADIEALSVFPELRRAYDESLIDPQFMHPSELDAFESAPAGRVLEATQDRHPPIGDVAEATGWWGCFARDRGSRARGEPKVGRNEPCPCGSGKKYKKCCGA